MDDAVDAARRAGRQEIAGAFDVDPASVVVRQPVADETGAVEDALRSRDGVFEPGPVTEVALDEFHAGLVQLRRALRPADEDPDLVALFHQRIHQPATDESGRPGHKAQHGHEPPVAVRRSSSVRIRALSTEISDSAMPGSADSSRWKSHFASSPHSVGSSAMTVAARGRSSITPISPKKLPDPSSTMSIPSSPAECRTTRTLPDSTT